MQSFAARIIRWSRTRPRRLPWRTTRDPYRIWVSEIMLAQTRVEAAVPYYRAFLKRFPSPCRLAAARLDAVLRVWEGLGYYARARNLHRAARLITSKRRGRLPRRAADWQQLPGVGRYAAAAIASLAYDEPAVALDANVRRILARVFAWRRSVRGSSADRGLARFFVQTRGTAKPGAFFQALMDLGQTVCLPRRPRCDACPISSACVACRKGWQNLIPARTTRPAVPHADVTAALIRKADRVLLARRPAGKILAGMWEFPGGKRERGENLAACLRRELREELGVSVRVGEKLAAVEHAFTHLRITLHVFVCDSLRGTPRPIGAAAVRWVRIRDLAKYPLGKADRIVAELLARE
jgi:A/G-specific adenine glycosylase